MALRTSLGRLELELDPAAAELSIWLFSADGRVTAVSGDEWEQADVSDLLRTEIGLPSEEAESIANKFVEAAQAEGHRQLEPSNALGNVLGLVVVVIVLALLGIGVWTVISWML